MRRQMQGWRVLRPVPVLPGRSGLVCSQRTPEASARGSLVQWHPQCHPWGQLVTLTVIMQEGVFGISPTGSYPRGQRGVFFSFLFFFLKSRS